MGILYDNYIVKEETYLKCRILTNGVEFSELAIEVALKENAKGQNLVYNMPINASRSRPQEIIVKNKYDGYSTVISCVTPQVIDRAVIIDVNDKGDLIAIVNGEIIKDVEIHFVCEPHYYQQHLSNGHSVKKYISACGLDELNILPWKGCAISKCCRFCGVNNFINNDEVSAFTLKKDELWWDKNSTDYLKYLKEAIKIAMKETCYDNHMHVILIAGNLSNMQLDLESKIFAEIARQIKPLVEKKATEGIVLVITPPYDLRLLSVLKESGISKVVFNIEAISEKYYQKYCPGKAELGYNYFIERLEKAVEVFGIGNVWSNLVLGLEPLDISIDLCERFAKKGIVISANVLHLDKGNTLDCNVPTMSEVLRFYYKLDNINGKYGYTPYYCSEALRTSLSNEVHDGRVKERGEY